MFKSFFSVEFRRRIQKKEIIIFLVVLTGLILMVHRGKANYLKALSDIKTFQEIENVKVKEYRLYRQYGSFGIDLLFVPSPFSILHSDYAFEGLQANVNVAEKLNIYKAIKGKRFFSIRTGIMSFAGILLLLGTGVALVYGYDSTKNRDKPALFFSSAKGKKGVWPFIRARLIILNAAAIALVLVPLVSLLIDKINLFQSPLISFIEALLVAINFFFALGGLIGFLKHSIRGVVLVGVYLLGAVILPYLAEINNEVNAADIEPLLKFELASMKIIRGVDRQLIEKHGSLKSTESAPIEVIKDMQKAVANEHGKIKEREARMRQQVLKKINRSHTISALFPVLFYLSASKEISSHGGLNLVDFYQYCQQRKAEFIDFYVDRRFLTEKSPDRLGVIENFIKGDENLFYANHRLPVNFGFGFMVSLAWVACFLLLLKKAFVRYLSPRNGQKDRQNVPDFKKNKIRTYVTNSPEQKSKIVAGIHFQTPRIVQVPGWNSLPGNFKVEWFFSFFDMPLPEKLKSVTGRYCNDELSPDLRALIITEIIRNFEADVFIFDEFLNGLSDDFVDYFKELLKTLKKGRHIVYFTASINTSSKIGDKMARYYNDPSL